MTEKFLRKVLAKIKEVEKQREDWLSYHAKRNIEISAWRWVVEEARRGVERHG